MPVFLAGALRLLGFSSQAKVEAGTRGREIENQDQNSIRTLSKKV